MLQTQTIQPKLLELLTKIMSSEVFRGFNLVGGTSLALQIGHRFSIDIDILEIVKLMNTSLLKNFRNLVNQQF